jgi:hypothetical protein
MLLSLVFVLFLMTAALSQNIPNRGFETWKTYQLYEEPESWLTSNVMLMMVTDTALLVTKTEDAASGDYAMYLANYANEEDTLNAFTFCEGRVEGEYPNLQFLGGFPYSEQPDSLIGYFKYDIQPGDTARLLVIFKKNGAVLAENWFLLSGTQTDYQRIAFGLQELGEVPDTALIGISAGTPWTPKAGSYLYVDNLAFDKGTQTIPNGDFETWAPLTYEDPEGWNSGNIISVVTYSDMMCSKTADAHSGDYAMRLETVYLNLVGDSVGIVSTGDLWIEQLSGGFPVQSTPTVIQGYYKYFTKGDDVAQLAVIGTKWDEETRQRSQYIRLYQLKPIDTYTFFSDTLSLEGEVDTINLVVTSGAMFKKRKGSFDEIKGGPPLGSVLYLDDLWLVSPCDYADTTQLFDFHDTTICAGSTLILDAGDGYAGYLWSDNSTGQTLTVSDSGDYSVTVTDADGCMITDGVTVHVDACTGVKMPETVNTLRIYPNPCQEHFYVELPYDATGIVQITVSNILGQMVQEQEVLTGSYDRLQVDMSGKADGIYFVHVRWNGGEKVLKLIKR